MKIWNTKYLKIYNSSKIISDGWTELNKIISVEQLIERKNKVAYSKNYYINSIKSDKIKFPQKEYEGIDLF